MRELRSSRGCGRRTGVALATLGAAGLVGCGNPPPSKFPTADDALGRMHATYACVNAVKGNAKIDHKGPRGRVRGEMYVLTENPDHVRFDVLTPVVTDTLFTLTSDGTSFALYDKQQSTFTKGPASPCNLAKLTQVPVPGHALVSLLRGEAPVLVHEAAKTSIAWEDGHYALRLESKHDAKQEIHLVPRPEDFALEWSKQRVRVTFVRVTQKGYVHYEASLKNHAQQKTADPIVDPDGIDEPVPPSGPACDAELPLSLAIEVPSTREDVIFQYKDARWNPPLYAGSFTQKPPAGVRAQLSDCIK